jgi:CRISP-associated protein Cas1
MSKLRQQFLSLSNFDTAWCKVAKNRGCAGVDGETINSFAHAHARKLQQLRQLLQRETYFPLPLRQIFIPKKDGQWRELRVPTVRDRIVQQALLQILYPIVEEDLEESSFAYRPGRSHLQAARRVEQWHHRGYDWVFEADINDYFENILHPRLLEELQESVDFPWVLSLITRWLNCGVLTHKGIILPQKGIPQGSVIAPLLANIYLDDFDEFFNDSSFKLVRYADDFVILARSEKLILEAQDDVRDLLEEMGLVLNPNKSQITNFKKGFKFLGHVFAGNLMLPPHANHHRQISLYRNKNEIKIIHAEASLKPTVLQLAFLESLKAINKPIPPPLYIVLGYTTRNPEPIKIISTESVWSREMYSLYLVQQGSTMTKSQGRFVIKFPNQEETEIPIQEVERILIFGHIQLSTSVIEVCLNEHIPVIFLTQLGDYKGHIHSNKAINLNLQIAQFGYRDNESFRLAMAQMIVRGKILNSKQFLLRLNRKRQLAIIEDVITTLDSHLSKISQQTSINGLLGHEGNSAARYFTAFGHLIINKGFQLSERNRQPPKDPVNSLLSLGYTLLFNNVMGLILAEGLNPYLGNLHQSQAKNPELALDLMEEFRSPIVDSLVLELINKKILKPTDFTFPNEEGGVYLVDTARRIFFKNFEQRINDLVSYPDLKEQVSYRRAIHLQVIRYKRCLIESISYEPFLRPV